MMRKAMLLTLLSVLALFACTDHRYPTTLVAADSLCAVNPDSALSLLTQYKDSIQTASKAHRMYYHLLLADAKNKTYVDMTSDSILKEVADYYDRHGSANEQMRAHYLLGCAYRDMGEAPMALQCYQDAVDKADTTDMSCITLLYKIHGQMAYLFYNEYMPEHNLDELRQAEHYAWLAGDTLAALSTQDLKANAYEELNMNDSVITIHTRTIDALKLNGFVHQAYQVMGALIHALIADDRLSEAMEVMSDYEKNSGLFDPHGNISSGYEIYYYAKGMCFLKRNVPDSASYYFRKELQYGNTENDTLASYTGLHLLYTMKHIPDSAMKYAQLRISKTDSIYENTASKSMYRIQAMFDYSRQQDVALQKTRLANQVSLILLIAVFIIIIGILSFIYYRYRQKILTQTRFDNYQQTVDQLRQEEYDLKKIHKTEYMLLEKEKTQKINELKQTIIEMEKRNPYFLEKRLRTAPITNHFKKVASNLGHLEYLDWKTLSSYMKQENPVFIDFLNNNQLRDDEYRLCLLVRLYFSNSQICNVCELKPTHVSMMRKRLSVKLFNKELDPKEFDERIQLIC
jgi:hypothetical protein